ncbi:MAG: N-succinylarginine dihydrolase [Pseudohongiellaceae bacterium]
MKTVEVNFDGLVGPTHNYAGLSHGNVASQQHRHSPASPRAAALQGLAKMRRLGEMGLVQGVLPPHERPHMPTLHRLGFRGNDAQILAQAAREAPSLLAAVSSAAAMWAANAATVSPSADSDDGRLHVTPANLNAKFHRSIEHPTTERALRALFSDPVHFAVHEALPASPHFGDEGAANHTRLCAAHGAPGLHLFVYGRESLNDRAPAPQRYPARQTREACQALARRHGLEPEQCVFAQQNPAVIDKGVFHNDVIAVGNGPVLLYHEEAFLDSDAVLREINEKLPDAQLLPVPVSVGELDVEEAISSYLFNSQLVSLENGDMALIVPQECQDSVRAREVLERIVRDNSNPIRRLEIMDLKQSMRNGGGPACLRLRVVLTGTERQAVSAGIVTHDLLGQLESWVDRNYRDELTQDDLGDPALLDESRSALDELTRILDLGPIYDFQRSGA